jgi:hypothetical protein
MRNLELITETVEGYEVKELRYKKMDNILVGLVKCPICGRENFNDGFVSGQWRTNGSPINSIDRRADLKLKIESRANHSI